MRKFKLAVLAFVTLTAAAVLAANVTNGTWIKMYGKYGRSDGIFQHKTSGALHAVVNGTIQGPVGKGFYIDFTTFGDGDQFTEQSDGSAVDLSDYNAGAGPYNFLYTPGGTKIGFAQTEDATLGPDMDAGSLDIGCDQTDDEGVELWMGMMGADGAPFIIGFDPAFYTCATITAADVSGTDDFLVGFRKAEIPNDAINDYADYFALNLNAGNVILEEEIGGASAAATDTTVNVADTIAVKFCVYVTSAGVGTVKVNGVVPPTVSTYTFTDALAVVPFIHHVQKTADLNNEADITYWEAGYGTP